jgi:hypothetical protein
MRSQTSVIRSATQALQQQTDSLLKQASELKQQNEQLSRQNSDLYDSLISSLRTNHSPRRYIAHYPDGSRYELESTRKAALASARLYDDIIRSILDKALGPTGWTMADVPQLGQILQDQKGVTRVFWDGRHLATIRQRDEMSETVEPMSMKWRRIYEVDYHVVRSATRGPVGS